MSYYLLLGKFEMSNESSASLVRVNVWKPFITSKFRILMIMWVLWNRVGCTWIFILCSHFEFKICFYFLFSWLILYPWLFIINHLEDRFAVSLKEAEASFCDSRSSWFVSSVEKRRAAARWPRSFEGTVHMFYNLSIFTW